jgi:hypothetical protein
MIIDEMKEMLHYKRISTYVNNNRKDDIGIGILYIVGATIVNIVVSFISVAGLLSYSMLQSLSGPSSRQIMATDPFMAMGIDITTYIIMLIIGGVVGFFSTIIGLGVIHYIASILGGKARIGEYFFIGGKFILFATIIYMVFAILNLIPCIQCITAILTLVFAVYAIYLFIVLTSTLYSISKLRAFAAIIAGGIAQLVVSMVVLSIIGILTNLPLGIKGIERMMESYSKMYPTMRA